MSGAANPGRSRLSGGLPTTIVANFRREVLSQRCSPRITTGSPHPGNRGCAGSRMWHMGVVRVLLQRDTERPLA